MVLSSDDVTQIYFFFCGGRLTMNERDIFRQWKVDMNI